MIKELYVLNVQYDDKQGVYYCRAIFQSIDNARKFALKGGDDHGKWLRANIETWGFSDTDSGGTIVDVENVF